MWNIIHARFWTNKQIINRLTEFGKMARRLMRDSKGEPEEKQIKLDDECSQCSSTTCWNKRKLTTARRWIMIQTKIQRLKFFVFCFRYFFLCLSSASIYQNCNGGTETRVWCWGRPLAELFKGQDTAGRPTVVTWRVSANQRSPSESCDSRKNKIK